MSVTRHGSKRIKSRMGLPKKAVDRQFKLALERGKYQKDLKGQLAKYGTKIALAIDNHPHSIVMYNGYTFIYGMRDGEPVLITVLPIPQRLMNEFKALTK